MINEKTSGNSSFRHSYAFIIAYIGVVNLIDVWYGNVVSTSNAFIIKELCKGDAVLWAIAYGFAGFGNYLSAPFGMAFDRFGRKLMMLLVYDLIPLSTGLVMYFFGFDILVVVIVYAVSMSFQMCNLWAVPLGEHVSLDKRGVATSIVNNLPSLLPLPIILFPWVIENFNWRLLWILSAGYILLSIILWTHYKESGIYINMKRQRQVEKKKNNASSVQLLRGKYSGPFIVGTLCLFTWNLTTVLNAWSGHYLMNIYSFTPSEYSLISLLGIPFGVASSLIFSRISDKMGRKPVMVGGGIGIILTFSAFGLIPDMIGVGSIWFIFPLTRIVTSGLVPVLFIYAVEQMPTNLRGTGQGLTMAIGRSAYIAGNWLIAWLLPLIPRFGYIYPIISLFQLLSMSAMFLLKPTEMAGKPLIE